MIYYLIQQVFTLFQSISLLEGQAEVELKLRKKRKNCPGWLIMALWLGFRNEKNKNLFQPHLGKYYINEGILIHFLLSYPVFIISFDGN